MNISGSGDPANLMGVAFSSGGKLLAVADTNGTVQLWNVASRQRVGKSLSFSNGDVMVSVSLKASLLTVDADGYMAPHPLAPSSASGSGTEAVASNVWASTSPNIATPNRKLIAKQTANGNDLDLRSADRSVLLPASPGSVNSGFWLPDH